MSAFCRGFDLWFAVETRLLSKTLDAAFPVNDVHQDCLALLCVFHQFYERNFIISDIDFELFILYKIKIDVILLKKFANLVRILVNWILVIAMDLNRLAFFHLTPGESKYRQSIVNTKLGKLFRLKNCINQI